MDVDPEETDWVFRADFQLGAAGELRAKRTILQLPSWSLSEALRRKIFELPISLCLSLAMTGGIAWYFLQDEALGKAMMKAATFAVFLLVVVELLCFGLLYAIARLTRSRRPGDLFDRLKGGRPVSFEADAKGYRWTAQGAAVEGEWSSVDAVWNGKAGLAVIRGADVAFVPREVFSTETAFVSTIDMMMKLSKANDPIRIDA